MLLDDKVVITSRDRHATFEDRSLAALGVDLAAALGDELAMGSRVVYAVQAFLIRTGQLCDFACATSKEIATDDGKVGEEFTSFRVGKDEGEERAEVLNCCFAGRRFS
jgi:hypothetical protein